MKYTITLSHGPNEDIPNGGYWQTPSAPVLAFVNVNTLREAKELFEAWRDDNGFGIGNMTLTSGIVSTFPKGSFVGQFSYNGRFWDKPELAKDRNEIKIQRILEANPVLKSEGFEDKARRWNALLEQARALNLTPSEQIQFIKNAQEIK